MIEDKKERAAEIAKRLNKAYPNAHVELDYSTPFELMIASILAAQNRDTTINKITPNLFRKYPTPAHYLATPAQELEEDIHKSGFFRQKTKAIRAVCEHVIERFNGVMPTTMSEMLTLPGIGRKTATVVLGDGMGIAEGITIDVHNLRVTPRLGLSNQKLADKMEIEMLDLVANKHWLKWGQLVTWHGRRVCHAKKPDCPNCVLNDICPSAILFAEPSENLE